nr:hypothetical protein BaRGS_031410 [Batillaria attramentaria]
MWTREYVPITQPINIRHTDHSLWTREQHPVAQPINVQETDSRDDFAQQHVLYCLQTLGEQRQEAMFVMSSLDFTDYLNKLDATHAAQFPLPGDLPSTQREGDFDVIVIHRKYGVLLGEIKSVGIHDNNPTDKAVADKVTKAVKQLDKCEKVVNHVMSDVAPGVSVRKTLILPYISRTQLQHVLDGDSQLAKQQLVMTLQADPTTQQAAAAVHFLHYDLWNRPGDVEAALQTLQSLVPTTRGQQLHVLIDEADFSLREVARGVSEANYVHNYSDSGTPYPSDGPRVIRLRHEGGDHTGRWPVECWRCGAIVARVLTEDLHVGANINPTSVGTTTSPPRLQYRDVIVLTRNAELLEETRDVRGQVTSQASGVVRGLRSAGLPVGVIGGMSDGVARAQADDDAGRTDYFVEAYDRVQLMSRCSTQLVIVDVPL